VPDKNAIELLELTLHFGGEVVAVDRRLRRDAAVNQPRSTRISAIWTALVAAPLRMLSETTQNATPRPSSRDVSERTRPT